MPLSFLSNPVSYLFLISFKFSASLFFKTDYMVLKINWYSLSWGRLSLWISSLVVVSFYVRLEPCGASSIHFGSSIVVGLVQLMFLQSREWVLMDVVASYITRKYCLIATSQNILPYRDGNHYKMPMFYIKWNQSYSSRNSLFSMTEVYLLPRRTSTS